MMSPVNNNTFINKTPYFIRYNKSLKIEPQNTFNINDEILDICKIQVWYGKKWTMKSEIFLIENEILFKNTRIDKSFDLPVTSMNLFQTIGNMLSKK